MSLSSRASSLPAITLSLLVACAPAAPAAAPDTPAGPALAEPSGERAAEAGAHEHGKHEHGGHEPGAARHGFHKDFSDASSFSASFDNPARDAWQQPEAVIDLMKIEPASTVVDLGAGTGYFVPRLSQRVGAQGKVLALDVEPQMIEFLNRRVLEQKLANVEPRLVQPNDPGLSPASVSRILIVNTWHHIGERPSYARKLAAALAPRGEVWIVDFTLDADRGPPPEYRLPAEQVVRELEQGGLHAQVVEPEPLPKQYIVRATR